MTDVSALGLGLMGSALARSLVDSGHDVTVWNRSPAKMDPLVRMGAAPASTVAAAVEASPIVLVNIDDYPSTRALFDPPDVVEKLSGRVIVQLSTGAPQEAREFEEWLNSQGADYLDGALLCYPEDIGTPDATIVYSGRRSVFDRCEALLTSLGEDSRFVGERVGSAATLDLAWLSSCYGAYAGAAHGVVLCETEGVDLGLYASIRVNSEARWIIDTVKESAFGDPTATLSVWNAALRRIRDHARAAEINSEVPDFVAGILDRAEAAGHGSEHIAAMVKVLRELPGS
jgi:3-hydroxyisobutyrate dehydrogenase-like beta-hydroxyacid dehydrogenase